MKALKSILCVLTLFVFVFAGCEKEASDWVQYHKDADGNVYWYDQNRVKVDAANYTVEVWAKQVYSDMGRTIELQSRIKDGLSMKGYDKLAHKTCRYAIDCGKKGITVLSISHFDSDGESLYFDVDKGEKKMFIINPGSPAAALQKEVCSKKQ
ncbi:MAG TPA: hypothetical protein PK842_03995 [Smithella sp.]|jgi:hypothetical protein|nr:hypothetical protein [Smithella sp.]NMC97532.1 hypothetical protein [Deltaproteobacteria bacterium]HNQ65805.1 hypothetical protein [Smithella sp.]HOG09715.1 hypothetical protein [Smithella sp.]HOO35853.1 hypothetical protein [Smithella sp.]